MHIPLLRLRLAYSYFFIGSRCNARFSYQNSSAIFLFSPSRLPTPVTIQSTPLHVTQARARAHTHTHTHIHTHQCLLCSGFLMEQLTISLLHQSSAGLISLLHILSISLLHILVAAYIEHHNLVVASLLHSSSAGLIVAFLSRLMDVHLSRLAHPLSLSLSLATTVSFPRTSTKCISLPRSHVPFRVPPSHSRRRDTAVTSCNCSIPCPTLPLASPLHRDALSLMYPLRYHDT
jgi:hypothetical protein